MANSSGDRTSIARVGRGIEAMKGMPSMVEGKSFSFKVQRGVSVLTILLCTSGCSVGTDRLNAWPGPVAGTESQRSGTEDSDSSTTGDGSSSQNGDVGSHEDSLPEGDSMDPGEGSTEDEGSANSSSSGSETGSEPGSDTDTETEDSGSADDSSEEGPGPGSCKLELCLEINGKQELSGETWKYRRYIFPFKIAKKAPRLARVEIVEGFTKGKTRAVLKSSNGKGQGPALARWSWEVDMPNRSGWNGGDLSYPVRLQSETWYWFEFIPAQGSLASVAKAGRDVALWRRNNPTRRWVKEPAPAMFRAYCCVQ